MSDTPLVSILTPSLNQAAYMRDCVLSVRRQDYPDIEHVIVDGGSTDGTVELARELAVERSRVVVLPGSTQAQALNEALAQSEGEIIGWLNSDDAYLGVDAVSTAVRRLAEAPHAVAAYGDGMITDERGRVLRHVSTSAADIGRLRPVAPLFQPAVFVRREALAERFVSEDVRVMIDYELWLHLARKGEFVKVERVLAIDRDYPGRKTHTTLAVQREDLRTFAQRYGLPLDSRRGFARAASAWLRRARGVAPLVRLERDYTFAFACETDARWRRVARQLFLPQRLLSAV